MTYNVQNWKEETYARLEAIICSKIHCSIISRQQMDKYLHGKFVLSHL